MKGIAGPQRKVAIGLALFVAAMLAACAPTIAGFDIEAYKTATSLKAETDAVLSHGTEPYSANLPRIEALSVRLNSAREYAAGFPRNGNSARQWELMVDPNQGLAGGTLRLWREKGQFHQVFVDEQRKQIAEGFDYIICLEANKQKAAKCMSQAATASTVGE
jgi:hypothetical protein